MDGDVKSHEFMEFRIIEAEHVGVVSTVIESTISVSDVLVVAVLVGEDEGCDSGALGGHVEAIFEGGFPVLGLVDTTVVGLHEVRLGLAHQNTSRELSHGVHILGERFNESFLFVGEGTTVEEIFLEGSVLGVTGELSSEEKPESTFGSGLSSSDGLVSVLSNIKEIVTTVGNTIFSMELRGLPEHTGESTHATEDGTDRHVSDDGVGVLLSEGNELLLAARNDVGHLLLEDRSRERSLG